MIKQLVLIGFMQLPLLIFAQDTLYFDQDWQETTRDQYSYYRLLPVKKVGELYLIQDFYKNGKLQMQGYALANNPDVYVGDVYWYDRDGNDQEQRQILNTSTVKELIYYNHDGSLWKKIVYNRDGKKEKICVFLNDKIVAEGRVTADRYYGVFSPSIPDPYYEHVYEEDLEPRVVTLEAPLIMEADEVLKNRVDGETGFSEVVFWTNGIPVMEKKYNDAATLTQVQYWNNDGRPVNQDSLGRPLINFTYYMQNGFAAQVKTEQILAEDGFSPVETIVYNIGGDVKNRTTYADGNVAEIRWFEKNKYMNTQKYRNGIPFEGYFNEEIENKIISYQLLQGQKIGVERVHSILNDSLIAEGIFRDGKPWNGVFYYTGDHLEIRNYKDGELDGLQRKFIDQNGIMLDEEYEMRLGMRNGFRRIYNEGNVQFESQYMEDQVLSGSIWEGDSQLTYSNGQLLKKSVFERDKETLTHIETYENNQITQIEYFDFTIEEVPQKSYKGRYSGGKPFDGYFKLDTLVDDIRLVSFFNKGVLESKFSFDFLEQMENYLHYTYNQKTSYEKGKILNGPGYKLVGKERLINSFYKDGKLTAFDVNLFAMHYFNKIIFRKENDVLSISELESPLKLEIGKKDGTIVAAVLKDNVILKSTKPLRTTGDFRTVKQYYLQDSQLKEFVLVSAIFENIEDDDIDDQEVSQSLLFKLYSSLLFRELSDVESVFQEFYTNFQKEDFEEIFEVSMDENYPINEQNYLAYLECNDDGSPLNGTHIAIEPSGQVVVSLFVNGTARETKRFEDISSLLRNDKAELRELEEKMYRQ
ncbi:hypothetical protein [Sphingobacterium sp. LRF_L2]|uniref:hypothetical protein n=1 Tax=Sphingobacterium sp. LRF_L2 TaxID=3369421 RepID=UPI003F5E362C